MSTKTHEGDAHDNNLIAMETSNQIHTRAQMRGTEHTGNSRVLETVDVDNDTNRESNPNSDTRCRESPSAWRTENKKHVHVSFILNNGKLSPRRVVALVTLEMIDPKKNPFNCTSKKDV